MCRRSAVNTRPSSASDYTGRLATESDCRRIPIGHNTELISYARAGGIVTLTAH